MRELMLFMIYLVIAIFIMALTIHVLEWSTARDFGNMKISYRDFRRWLKKDPSVWRFFSSSNVQFYSYNDERFYMCYFGFFGLMAYKRYYYATVFSKPPKKHRLTKAESREKVELSYEKKQK